MTVSPDGNLVFHQSSINRIGLVMIGGSNCWVVTIDLGIY
jgi:hypothetical protein